MENNLNPNEGTPHKNNTSTLIENFSNDPSNDVLIEKHDINQFKKTDTNYNISENTSYTEDSSNTDDVKSAAKKDMLVGGLWFFGGIAVTAITYSMASGGGRYFLAWGAIIFGGIQFFKGLINSSK